MKQFIKLAHISALTVLVIGCKDPSRTKTMDFGLFTISKVRFNLCGADLKTQTEQDLLKATKTLRFHKRNIDNEEN